MLREYILLNVFFGVKWNLSSWFECIKSPGKCVEYLHSRVVVWKHCYFCLRASILSNLAMKVWGKKKMATGPFLYKMPKICIRFVAMEMMELLEANVMTSERAGVNKPARWRLLLKCIQSHCEFNQTWLNKVLLYSLQSSYTVSLYKYDWKTESCTVGFTRWGGRYGRDSWELKGVELNCLIQQPVYWWPLLRMLCVWPEKWKNCRYVCSSNT